MVNPAELDEPIGSTLPGGDGGNDVIEDDEQDRPTQVYSRIRRVDNTAIKTLNSLAVLFTNQTFFTEWVKASAESMRREIKSERELARLREAWEKLQDAFKEELKQHEIKRYDMSAPPRLPRVTHQELSDIAEAASERRKACVVTPSTGSIDERVASLLSRILHPIVEPSTEPNIAGDYRSLLANWIRLTRSSES